MECNYEGVDELLRELEQEAEHPVQRRAENERHRDYEKKSSTGFLLINNVRHRLSLALSLALS